MLHRRLTCALLPCPYTTLPPPVRRHPCPCVQVGECGLTYAPPSSALRLGGLLLPLVVLAVSMAVVEMLHP